MVLQAKRDGNVPFLPGRSRYSVVGLKPCWVYHEMDTGMLTGVAPRTLATDEASTDPVVTAGLARFTALSAGGLFTLVGNAKASLVVEAMDVGAGTVTIVVVDPATPGALLTRSTVSAAPFPLSPGEYLKVTGVGKAGFKVRLAGEDII
jgi:hypothetical protein